LKIEAKKVKPNPPKARVRGVMKISKVFVTKLGMTDEIFHCFCREEDHFFFGGPCHNCAGTIAGHFIEENADQIIFEING